MSLGFTGWDSLSLESMDMGFLKPGIRVNVYIFYEFGVYGLVDQELTFMSSRLMS